MALLVVIAVIVVVTLGVGVVGIARIGKDRPPLKSYELPPERTPDELEHMRLAAHEARMRVVATDLETDSDTQSTESHVRARGGEESRDGARRPQQSLAADLIQFLAKTLVQLTGIPLLTGEAADPSTTPTTSSTTMGNTAKPSLAVHGDVDALHNTAEIDVLRDNKPQAASTTATIESRWSEQESSSGNSDDESSSYDDESDIEETKATVTPLDGFMLDGMQFYATVAKLSIATTHNAIDIGLFRASAIILRQRRKALEDACIHAVEQQYPDIMCLPSNARYSSPAPSSKSLRVNGSDVDAVARTQVASPTARAQLETSFLKAA